MLTGVFIAVVCAGCTLNSETTSREGDDRPVVLTTFTVLADIVRNVAGAHVRVESITTPGVEIHGYEPTPGDLTAATDADLVLDNGLGLEAWFADFVAELDAPHAVLSEGVDPIGIGDADAEERPNPHAWMSPTNVETYVANAVSALSSLVPDRTAEFASNATDYIAELDAITDEFHTRLDALPDRRRALVTCEGAFSYLARDAGLSEAYIWPVNADQQGTPQQLIDTISFVTDNEVPAVFCESTVSDAVMQQVVEATDATFGGTLYVDSLSDSDGPVPTYLDLIRHDVDTIADALTGEES